MKTCSPGCSSFACSLGAYFGAGGFVLWLLDKALSRVPRYRDWKENLLGGADDYDD